MSDSPPLDKLVAVREDAATDQTEEQHIPPPNSVYPPWVIYSVICP